MPKSGTGISRGLALLATALGFGVVQLDVTVVNVAIRPIGRAFGGDVSGLQWVVNAYTLVLAAFLLSAGALGDRLGAKRVFVGGFGIFTVASVACGLAPTLGVLVAARAVQGVGAAALIPCSLAILNHTYPDARARTRAVGIWAACASVALSAGPLIGGALIETLGWRAIFFINVPLGVAGIVLTLVFAAETSRTPRRFDLPGQLLAVSALASLAAATIEGGREGYGNPLVLGGFAIFVAAAAGFILVERRRQDPMLPLDLFRARAFSASAAVGLLVNIAFYGLIFVLSLYFQSVLDYGVLLTGAAFAPMTVAVLAGNLLAGRAADAVGSRRLLVVACTGFALAVGALLVAGRDTPFGGVVAQLVVVGLALGLAVPAFTSSLLGSVDRSVSGAASGVLNTARQTGSVIGVALFGALAAGGVVSGLHVSALISAGLALAAAAVSLAILGQRRPGSRSGTSGGSR